jgi:hypothetical protein
MSLLSASRSWSQALRGIMAGLLSKGFRVRALVRQRDDRAEAIATEGAEVVVGDYAKYASLLDALDGVHTAYFCYPVGTGIAEAAGLFATAGKKHGPRRIVDLSLRSTSPDSATPQGRGLERRFLSGPVSRVCICKGPSNPARVLYALVARNRYRWFGKVNYCALLTTAQRSRLLWTVDCSWEPFNSAWATLLRKKPLPQGRAECPILGSPGPTVRQLRC